MRHKDCIVHPRSMDDIGKDLDEIMSKLIKANPGPAWSVVQDDIDVWWNKSFVMGDHNEAGIDNPLS